MDTTPHLLLPYIADAQAQKHVTHNEAIRALDAVVQLSVLDRDASTPPVTAAEGNRFLVAISPAPSGAWVGRGGQIAAFQDGGWLFYAPKTGWCCWVADEAVLIAFDGTVWQPAAAGSMPSLVPLLGINATATTAQRLAVASAETLFTHAGADHRLKINKSAVSNTASMLLQTNFAGRAEIGLTGDDALHVKVSADGATWLDALVVDNATGRVALPETPHTRIGSLLINGAFAINQRSYAGAPLAAGAYGHDRWRAGSGGATYVVSTGGVVTLATGRLEQVIEPAVFGFTSFAATPLTVSVANPSAALTISLGSVSATLAAGTGRRSITLTPAAGDLGPLTFGIARSTSGTVSFAQLQIDVGVLAAAWAPRRPDEELSLCRRYFQRSYPLGVPTGAISTDGIMQVVCASTSYTAGFSFPVRMRAAPTLAIYSRSGSAGSATNFVTGADIGLGLFGVSPASVWYGQGSGLAVSTFYEFNYTAAAEF